MSSNRANARSNAAEASAQSRDLWQAVSSEGSSRHRTHNQAGDDGEVDWNEEWSSEEDDEVGDARSSTASPRLKVKPSTIANAGDGLFLASAVAVQGTVLIEEQAVPLKRSDAKRILADPVWAQANPIIQLNGDKFLDIRKLLLYKSNHAKKSERRCNAAVEQRGPQTLALVTTRDVRKGEEILWEYSPTWYPPGA